MGNASDPPNKHASLLAAFDDAIEEDGFKIEGYEILCEIDRGGMGVVYHARQLRPERDVALKVMLPKLGAEKAMRKRFQTEARAMAALDHPGILPIYEVGESNGLPFFSMKLATGGSLSERLKGEPIAGKVAATWLSEICSAVNHAHQRGVLHRDLKPANFLFDEEDRLYVADFGVAKLLDLENLDLTKTDGFVGTPHYMPPEVARGNSNEITVLGDLYSLGAVFYECLTGERPHKQHSHIGSLLRAIADEPISRPRDLQPDVPLDLDIICQKALEKSPNDRYSSVRSFRDDLQLWLEGRPIKARPVGLPEQAWRWSRRHPLTTFLSGSLVALTVIGGGLLNQSYHKQQQIALQESRLENARSARLLGSSGFRAHVLELLRKAASRETSKRIRSEAVAALSKIDLTPLEQAQTPNLDLPSDWPPPVNGDATSAITTSPDHQWSLTWHDSGQLALWKASDRSPRRQWEPAPLRSIQGAFLPDGLGLLVSRADLGTVVYSGEELSESRPLPVSDLSTFSLSPDGRRAAFGTDEGLELYDLEQARRLWYSTDGISRCAPSWSSDGRTIAAALGDMKQVTLYDADQGTELLIRSTSGWPQHLAFHPNGQFLGIVSDNETLVLMDLVAGHFLTPIDIPLDSSEIVSFRFSEDGSALSITAESGDTYSWQLHQAVGYREWSGHALTSTGGSVLGAKLSFDERFLLTTTTKGIEVWSIANGRQTAFRAAGNQRIDARTDAWWLPGPQREIMVQVPGALERVNIDAAGRILASKQVDREPGTTVLDIQSDGAWRVKILNEDGEPSFACWPQGDPSLTKPLVQNHPNLPNQLVASSRDGTCLAEALETNVVRLTGKRELTLTPPIHTKFQQILFAHDGDRLIGIAEDYRIFDWDLKLLDEELDALGFR